VSEREDDSRDEEQPVHTPILVFFCVWSILYQLSDCKECATETRDGGYLEEVDEFMMVSSSNAGSHHGTVMVMDLYTHFTVLAVKGTRRSHYVACLAYFKLKSLVWLVNLDLIWHVFWVFPLLKVPRHDPWLCEWTKYHESVSSAYKEKVQNRKDDRDNVILEMGSDDGNYRESHDKDEEDERKEIAEIRWLHCSPPAYNLEFPYSVFQMIELSHKNLMDFKEWVKNDKEPDHFKNLPLWIPRFTRNEILNRFSCIGLEDKCLTTMLM
jgi:hypothetical protein